MTSDSSSADIHDLSDLHVLNEDTVLECIRDRFYRDIIYVAQSGTFQKKMDFEIINMVSATNDQSQEPVISKVTKNAIFEGISKFQYLNSAIIVQTTSTFRLLVCARYQIKNEKTYIGDVLIVVNPFKELPIYDEKHHELYKDETVRKQNLPHVFWVAGSAFRNLMESRRGRCIIVGGISGAGKTESTKHIFEHILHQGGQHHPNLVENLKGINPLLEQFGNAETRLNDNSSRFGKLIGLKYDERGNLDEASISTYMLEKSRVITQHQNERNYHIFYAFVKGVPDEKLEEYGIIRRTLYDSRIIRGHTSKPWDDSNLATARRIMTKIGFTDQHIDNMYRILAAILIVVNVKFDEEESTGLTVIREDSESEVIPIVCNLLHIEAGELIPALISNTSYTAKGELITSGKVIQKAKDGRDAFAKYLYSCLFDALVRQINTFLKHMSGSHRKSVPSRESQFTCELSILDIAGFENLTNPGDRNSYEQLLINITNEHMHQFFLKKVFRAELETYEREGVKCEDLPDTGLLDNHDVIDLLSKAKLGILGILEDCTAHPKETDEGFVRQVNKFNHTRDNFRLKPRDGCAFCVKHFAGEVEYDARGFLDKNRDTLTEDLKKCLQKSDNFFLPRPSTSPDSISKQIIEKVQNKGRVNNSRAKLQGFLSKDYQKSLHSLVNKLEKSEPLFVRCIKSNKGQDANCFDEEFVKQQLLHSGVLEISRIRKHGYSIRMLFEEFLKKFGKIQTNGPMHLPQRDRVVEVLKEAGIKDYITGDRLVFLKYAGLDTLEKMLVNIEKKKKEMEEKERQKRIELKKQREAEVRKSMTVDEIQSPFKMKDVDSSTSPSSLTSNNDNSSSATDSPISTATPSIAKEATEKIKAEEEEDKETLAFDAFRQRETTDDEESILESHILPGVRLFIFVCLFVLILGSGAVMKLLFRTLIDNYKKDKDDMKHSVDILLCICVPPGMTLVVSIVKVMFGRTKSLENRYLLMVMLIGMFHMLGVGLLIFNILPHFDAFRGNIILLNVAILPCFLSFLMKFKCSNCVPQRRFVFLIITTTSVGAQLGGVFCAFLFILKKDVIHTDDTGILKLKIMYPISVFFISIIWWENFVSGRMTVFCKTFNLDTLRRHLEKTRTKANYMVLFSKIVTIVIYALFVAKQDFLQITDTRVQPFVPNLQTFSMDMDNITVSSSPASNVTINPLMNTNSSVNNTQIFRSFIHNSQKYTCTALLNQTYSSVILSCKSGTTNMQILCENETSLCSKVIEILENKTQGNVFDDRYIIINETEDTVTFTNSTNDIICEKVEEEIDGEDMLRLFCENRGVKLELLCKPRYTECQRIYPESPDPSFLDQVVDLWNENYIVLCTLFLSVLFTYCSVLSCKLHMQQFSFSLSIILISPLTSGMIYMNCTEMFSFQGIIPDVASCAPMDFAEIKWSVIQGVGLWLSIILLTYYIWIPRYERMAKVERLFVEPLKDCFFNDINMLLRRKNDRTYRYTRKRLTRSMNPQDVAHPKGIPQIKVCATMWHETVTEMSQLLKSLFRLDIHHAASVRAQGKSNAIDPDSFTPEIHIIFDDAFETVTQNGRKIRQPNSYLMQFLECNEKAARDVAQCDASEWDCIPSKMPTPYGAQLKFTMPGGTKMFVHMKDKSKIRHRKRWSQIMYLYYLLGFKTFGMKKLNDILKKPANASASLFSFLKPEYQEQMKNTFILTLDGDVDFNPDAVILLLDRMKKNPKTGAVCGRIHPIGSGPMVWYQQFEYAIGHWLQKAAEHVLGCVLCCPGCFSLFRASALMDDNVMNTYTTKPTEARHYIQFEQGEDRWLCTLLLQQGHKIDYEAGADALTFAPESFNEFFVQRRRWAPSTMANIMDLLASWKSTVKQNDNISRIYIVYQFVMLMSSLLAPATITLMIAGSYSTVLSIGAIESFMLSLTPVAIFIFVCMKCKNDLQLKFAAVMSSFYTLIMILVTIGMVLNIANEDLLSPNVLFLCGLAIIFTLAGLWHPKEFSCLLHGVLYYFTVPSTFIFLTVYFFCNLNNVSWGTREGPKTAEAKPAEGGTATQQHAEQKGFFPSLFDLVRGTFCGKRIESFTKEIHERFKKNKVKEEGPVLVVTLPTPKLVDDFVDYGIWMHSGVFEPGEFLTCSDEETTFWDSIIKKYLYPLENDKKHQEQIKKDLASLRNNVVFAFFLLNFLFCVALLQLQLNREKILAIYIVGKYEPVSVIFLAVFSCLLIIQFIAMLFHRWGTFLHLVSNTKIRVFSTGMSDEELFRCYLKECVSLMNGKSPNLSVGKDAESESDKEDSALTESERHVNVDMPEEDYPDESDEGEDETEEQTVNQIDQNLANTLYNRRFKNNYKDAMRTVNRRRRRNMISRKQSLFNSQQENPRLDFYERHKINPAYRHYHGDTGWQAGNQASHSDRQSNNGNSGRGWRTNHQRNNHRIRDNHVEFETNHQYRSNHKSNFRDHREKSRYYRR